MKNRISWWSFMLAALAIPLSGGCLQDAVSSAKSPTIASNALVPAPDELTNAVPETNALPLASQEAEEPEDGIVTAEAKPITWERELPASVQSNPLLSEIIKLAEGGVDEGVMMAFVTNSTSRFNLGADEIIYLNDIGIPDAVVAVILQHDQALKSGGGENATMTTVWSSPAQTNDVEQQLSSAEMAPQSAETQGGEPPASTETTQVPAPPSQVTYNTFYSALAPYGTWVEIEGYGRCWQPSVVAVNSGWQPYLHGGRWVYSNYGWYWYSDYSWGWAPFHYGRWFRHYRLGWCWYPDVYWGPSWVSWSYSGSYCGWAPLPPSAYYYPGIGITYWGSRVGVSFSFGLRPHHYAYVPWHHFKHHRLHHHAVPHHYRPRIHREAVVATRIEGNRHAINRGLPVERVAAATKSEIRPVALREVRTPQSLNRGRAERLSNDGKTLAVYRPQLPERPREIPEAVRQRSAGGSGGEILANRSSPTRTKSDLRSTRPGLPERNQAENGAPNTTRLEPRNPVRLERPISARSLNRPTAPAVQPNTIVQGNGTRPNMPAIGTRSSASAARPATPSREVTTVVPRTIGRVEPDRIEPLGGRSSTPPDRPSTRVPGELSTRSAQTPPASLPRANVEPTRPATQLPRSAAEAPRRSIEVQRPTLNTPARNRNIEVPRAAVPQSSPRSALPQAPAASMTPSRVHPVTPGTALTPSVNSRGVEARSPRAVEVPRFAPRSTVVPQQNQGFAPTRSYNTPPRAVVPSPRASAMPQPGLNRSAPSAPRAMPAPPARSFSAPAATPRSFSPPPQAGGGGFSRPSAPMRGGGGNFGGRGERPSR